MELLPSSHEEFSQPEYWNRFFSKRGSIPFEWYGEYPQLHGVLHKYITPANRVLVVGCGNSALSENMYDNGLQHLVNIDISDIVIRQMKDKHKDKRSQMTFDVMDVTQMSYGDEEFNVALDKGTLDALMVSEEVGVMERVIQMFDQVCRTMKFGGRYIILSLLQDHVQKILLNYFTNRRWPIRIHKIDTESSSDSDSKDKGSPSSPLPVFAVVVTKLKVMPTMPQIVEVVRFEDQIDRLEDIKYLPAVLKDIQYYNSVRRQLSERSPDGKQVSLELHSKGFDTPRYRLVVVDSQEPMTNKFAIFIVPQGREHEWLFSTEKGRQHLQDSAQFQRLVVVSLTRGHEYECLDAIKAELSCKVMELAPKEHSAKSQTPFLSIGEDIGKRMPVAQGHSETTGAYLVEDVEINGGQVFRRLIFLSNQNIVQSEARMIRGKRRRRGKKPLEETIGNLKVDKGYLPSDYQVAMMGGFAYLPCKEESVRGVIIGLGGGSFSSFLHRVYPAMRIDTVELDASVVDIATNWFALETDEKFKVHVADGIQFIHNLAAAGERVDFIVIDADSKDNTTGLMCPAAPFVEPDFLQTANRVLTSEGILIVNLASRDEGLKEEVQGRIHDHFSSQAMVQLQEDINCIVYASKQPTSHPQLNMETLQHSFEQIDSKIKSAFEETNVDVIEMMESFSFRD